MPAITGTNPLLAIEFKIPFDRILAEDIEPAIQELLRQAHKGIEQIVAAPKPRTFAGTMRELDSVTERLESAMGIVRPVEAVATTPELRAAYNKVQRDVSAFYSSIPLNEGLWRAIQAYAATADAKSLTGTRKALDRKSTRLNSSHQIISYAVFCLKKKKTIMLSTLRVPPMSSAPRTEKN